MEKPTKIQRAIEYTVTNGLGYHTERNLNINYPSTSQAELSAHLLNLQLGVRTWDLIPREIVVDTTRRPDRVISYFGEQPGVEPIYDLGSGLGIAHPTREQREAIIEEGRRAVLQGGISRRPAEITDFVRRENLSNFTKQKKD